ncbi:putative 9-cis-epoxycarotenoid dioxygenase [Dioscorea sansibarensis]
MNSFCLSSNAHGSVRRPFLLHSFHHLSTSLSSTFKDLDQVKLKLDVPKLLETASLKMLDGFVDSTFQFINQPTLPSQRNFMPVEEIGEETMVTSIDGDIPADFPEGTYIRNGPNPLFGALQSTVSPLGKSSNVWVEGDGMLHAIYFSKNNTNDTFTVSYKNRYVESETFKIEKEKKRPCFLPAVEGDSLAILAACILNQLRFGKVNKYISNTNVFEHSGRCFSIAEHHIPQEIDLFSLDTLGNWDVNGEWNRPFTAHPKKAPGSGELVITGADAVKPFLVLGVISADGKRLAHKVDVKLERSILCHDMGVTERYNIIMDMPLTINVPRLLRGGPLIKYEKESYARIGVMPRYGDAEAIKWFHVQPYCTFHLINCYEDGDEVVMRGCRAEESIIPGPEHGLDKFQWFSKGLKFQKMQDESDSYVEDEGFLFSRLYEWRLNMKNGGIKERFLTGKEFSIDFPMINENFIGLRNKFAYCQVADSIASSDCGLPKFGSLVKFTFGEELDRISGCQELIKVEHHEFGENQFSSGSAFVPRPAGSEEDDGWIISHVHNEETNISQVHIIDSKRFECKAVAKITLPQRVPYGFHATFIKKSA